MASPGIEPRKILSALSKISQVNPSESLIPQLRLKISTVYGYGPTAYGLQSYVRGKELIITHIGN